MLSVLNQMPQRHGPDAFFNFPGRSAAVSLYFLILRLILKWHVFVHFYGALQLIRVKLIIHAHNSLLFLCLLILYSDV